ncbi:MAG: hypothetical protein ABJQ14_00800, partial [Hyphomicrobiales bacterium]
MRCNLAGAFLSGMLVAPAVADDLTKPPPLLPATFCDTLFDLDTPVFGSMEPVNQFLVMESEYETLPITLPRNYLEDMWDFNEGYSVPSHAFRVDIDTFEPIRSRDLKAFFDKNGQRSLDILIDDNWGLRKVLDTAIRWDLQSYEMFGGLTEVYDPKLGLTRIEPVEPFPRHKILFTNRVKHRPLIDVFSCRRPGDGVNQSCRHQFRVHDVDVYARYDDQHLPSWQIIKANVTTFLGCMLNFE